MAGQMNECSLHAYEEIKEELGERQLQVYSTIKELQYATNTMIAKYLNLPINCVTGRTNELRKKGIVEKSHISWDPITKNKATYWRLS
ncbi:hypothetical protein K9M79_02915 [Candidatus Woesearchaeota archaeon]|nr:hypothetical protein [Candidatus Woesearchaeota archaeon]